MDYLSAREDESAAISFLKSIRPLPAKWLAPIAAAF